MNQNQLSNQIDLSLEQEEQKQSFIENYIQQQQGQHIQQDAINTLQKLQYMNQLNFNSVKSDQSQQNSQILLNNLSYQSVTSSDYNSYIKQQNVLYNSHNLNKSEAQISSKSQSQSGKKTPSQQGEDFQSQYYNKTGFSYCRNEKHIQSKKHQQHNRDIIKKKSLYLRILKFLKQKLVDINNQMQKLQQNNQSSRAVFQEQKAENLGILMKFFENNKTQLVNVISDILERHSKFLQSINEYSRPQFRQKKQQELQEVKEKIINESILNFLEKYYSFFSFNSQATTKQLSRIFLQGLIENLLENFIAPDRQESFIQNNRMNDEYSFLNSYCNDIISSQKLLLNENILIQENSPQQKYPKIREISSKNINNNPNSSQLQRTHTFNEKLIEEEEDVESEDNNANSNTLTNETEEEEEEEEEDEEQDYDDNEEKEKQLDDNYEQNQQNINQQQLQNDLLKIDQLFAQLQNQSNFQSQQSNQEKQKSYRQRELTAEEQEILQFKNDLQQLSLKGPKKQIVQQQNVRQQQQQLPQQQLQQQQYDLDYILSLAAEMKESQHINQKKNSIQNVQSGNSASFIQQQLSKSSSKLSQVNSNSLQEQISERNLKSQIEPEITRSKQLTENDFHNKSNDWEHQQQQKQVIQLQNSSASNKQQQSLSQSIQIQYSSEKIDNSNYNSISNDNFVDDNNQFSAQNSQLIVDQLMNPQAQQQLQSDTQDIIQKYNDQKQKEFYEKSQLLVGASSKRSLTQNQQDGNNYIEKSSKSSKNIENQQIKDQELINQSYNMQKSNQHKNQQFSQNNSQQYQDQIQQNKNSSEENSNSKNSLQQNNNLFNELLNQCYQKSILESQYISSKDQNEILDRNEEQSNFEIQQNASILSQNNEEADQLSPAFQLMQLKKSVEYSQQLQLQQSQEMQNQNQSSQIFNNNNKDSNVNDNDQQDQKMSFENIQFQQQNGFTLSQIRESQQLHNSKQFSNNKSQKSFLSQSQEQQMQMSNYNEPINNLNALKNSQNTYENLQQNQLQKSFENRERQMTQSNGENSEIKDNQMQNSKEKEEASNYQELDRESFGHQSVQESEYKKEDFPQIKEENEDKATFKKSGEFFSNNNSQISFQQFNNNSIPGKHKLTFDLEESAILQAGNENEYFSTGANNALNNMHKSAANINNPIVSNFLQSDIVQVQQQLQQLKPEKKIGLALEELLKSQQIEDNSNNFQEKQQQYVNLSQKIAINQNLNNEKEKDQELQTDIVNNENLEKLKKEEAVVQEFQIQKSNKKQQELQEKQSSQSAQTKIQLNKQKNNNNFNNIKSSSNIKNIVGNQEKAKKSSHKKQQNSAASTVALTANSASTSRSRQAKVNEYNSDGRSISKHSPMKKKPAALSSEKRFTQSASKVLHRNKTPSNIKIPAINKIRNFSIDQSKQKQQVKTIENLQEKNGSNMNAQLKISDSVSHKRTPSEILILQDIETIKKINEQLDLNDKINPQYLVDQNNQDVEIQISDLGAQIQLMQYQKQSPSKFQVLSSKDLMNYYEFLVSNAHKEYQTHFKNKKF